jgi:hypothetical protein
MITIKIPPTYESERRYILTVMLVEFLGLDIQINIDLRQNVSISCEDRELLIADRLFATPSSQWLKPASLPQQPLKLWNLATTKLSATTVDPQIPVIYGDDPNEPNFFHRSAGQIYLGLDVFGSAFFMLTRYEEVVKSDLDRFSRFPVTSSLMFQENCLNRPIINEYLEILWTCLHRLFPKLQREHREFQLKLTHDVDDPFELYPFQIAQCIRRLGGDLVVRQDIKSATALAINSCKAGLNLPYQDRLDTFDWLMDRSEEIGAKSAFYFIAGDSLCDPRYDIQDSKICDLIEKIISRGHEVGLHPSYDTYLNPEKLLFEAQTLRQILQEKLDLELPIGGRQHYLRWKATDSWQHWEDTDLSYDSSVGFAEHSGFRSGICYEYPTFNLITRQQLKLKEYPLIVMECSLLSRNYMSISYADASKKILHFKNICKLFNGVFVLLWHNNQLFQAKDRILYLNSINE